MYFDSRVPMRLAKNEQDLFFLSLDFTNNFVLGVKGGGADTKAQTLQADQDAHLLLVGGSRIGTDVATDAVAQAFLPVLMTMKMSSSGRELMNNAQHIENVLGTAQLPAAWPRPKFLAAGSALRVTLQNLSATAAFNVRVTFYAFKIFLTAGE
jgi:hypothetical protein